MALFLQRLLKLFAAEAGDWEELFRALEVV
jgi:hypothetical protein